MPTLGPFFRYLRPSQWRHMADEHKDLSDNQGHARLALNPGWRPRIYKTSPPDSSIMNNSLKASQTAEPDLPLYSMRQSLSREPVWQHPKAGLEITTQATGREGDCPEQDHQIQVAMAR